MTDGVIKSTGNSRYLKSVANFMSLYPTYEDFVAALVAGTLPVDLNGINPNGWSTQGTPLNKANLLADNTGSMLGLGSTGTVNSALAQLGQYNQYWWRRYPFAKGTAETVQAATVTAYVTTTSIAYSSSLSYDGLKLSLNNPQGLTISKGSSATVLNALSGKYFSIGKFIYYYNGSPSKTTDGSSEYYKCSAQKVSLGTPGYVNGGNSSSAYPNPSGVSGSYYYEYLGKPLELFKQQKSVMFSYIGTGTYGPSSKNALTFPFPPKFVIIGQSGSIFSNFDTFFNYALWTVGTIKVSVNNHDMMFELSGNTLSYYTYANANAESQLNTGTSQYNVIAFG